MGTAFEKITVALEAYGSRHHTGGQWNCPGNHANGDRKPSLHVNQGREGVVLKCFTGCEIEEILMPLGLEQTDLFDGPPREVARYPYVDLDGVTVFAKIRYEPKKFSIAHPTKDGWEPGLNGYSSRPLYRFPEVAEAILNGDQVWVVNGEKSADRLGGYGIAATCNFEGEGTWKAEYGDCLKDADVVIVADRDETGVQHALDVCVDLKSKARSVRVVQSKTGGEHDDVVDHLDAGFGLDELVPLRVENEISRRYKRVDWADAWKRQPNEVDWLLDPVLEAGTINALFGKPGVGKSLLALSWAVDLIRDGIPVLIVDDENRVTDSVERLRAFGCTPEELDNLVMYNFAGLPPLDTDEGGQHLAALAEVNGARLVVLDTTTRMVVGDENAASTWLQLYRCSLVPLKGRGIAVLRLDHPGKEDSRGQRGSSAKAGDVDVIWRLVFEQGDMLTLMREKSRSGHGETAISYRRVKDPLLHHQVVALGDLDILPQVRAISRWFDKHSVPLDTGRPRLRDVLSGTQGAPDCSTTILALVAKYRKSLVGDSESHGPF